MLGRFSVTYRGKAVTTVDTSRLKSLLAYLVLNGGGGQPRAHLAFLFWPESSESQARTNLRQLLHHLRSRVPDCDKYLDVDPHALRWRAEADFSTDVADFERAASARVEEAGSNTPAGLRERLERAAALYGGDLLPGLYDEWVQAERRRLRQRYTDLLVRLVAHLEKTREYPAAISHAERLLSADPLSEASHQLLIRLHALNGDGAGALRAYRHCADVLGRELGVEPGISTRRLLEEVTQPEPALTGERLHVSRAPSPTLPLVGRRRELDRFLDLWRTAAAGRALFALVLGESGIGKTRLAEEAMSRAGQRADAVYARCYVAEQSLAYAPVTQWLRSEPIRSRAAGLPGSDLSELVRVVPELLKEHPGLSPPPPLTEGWQRRRFLETLARAVVASPQALLLVLDDLQWCDPETLDWLEFLLHFDPKAKLLVLATARPEDAGVKRALRPLLHRLTRDDLASEIVLAPLDRDETEALARLVSRQEIDSRSMSRIFGETEGNPLFVVESVRAGPAAAGQHELEGGPAQSTPVADSSLPPRVRAVLASRLAQLSPPAHELAGLAATIGRAFGVELLLRASTLREADLIPLIDELWERRIIHQARNGTYDFSHDRLRDVAYEELGPGRRSSLHRSVAEALEAGSAGETGAASSLVAEQYERAGVPARALPHYVTAAKSSRTRYADREAVDHFTRALRLLETSAQTRGRDEQELEILVLLGPALVSTRGYAAPEVGQVYDRARLLCEFLNARQPYFPVLWGSWVFNVVRANFQAAREFAARFSHLAGECGNATLVAAGHVMTGCTLFHVGKTAEARNHFVEGLERYDPHDCPFLLQEYGPELGVFCRSYLSHALCVLGFPRQSVDQSNAALARARELGDPFSITVALVYSAMLHQLLGDHRQCSCLAEQAAALCDEYGFGYYGAWPPIFRGWAMAEMGQAAQGAVSIQEGLDSLRRINSRLREPYYLGLLAHAEIAAGHVDDALNRIRDAFAVIEKGGETWVEPEIHRIKGNLLLEQGDSRGAGLSYQRASTLAIQQEAGSFALSAAISLGRVWTMHGKRTQAQKLLRELRRRLEEQADAPDLGELESVLGAGVRRRSPASGA